MAISLKTALDGNKGQKELSKILLKAKRFILDDIEQKKTGAKLGDLEKMLNGIFYPEKPTDFSSDYLTQLHKKAAEDEIIKVFENFNFENNKSGYHPENKPVNISALGQAINKAEKVLEILSNVKSTTNIEKLQDLESDIKEVINWGKDIRDKVLDDMTNRKYNPIEEVKDDNILMLINQLKAIASLQSSVGIPSPQEAGIIFEKALALTNIQDKFGNIIVNDIAKEDAKDSWFGSRSIERGKSNNPISYSVSMKLFENDKEKAKKQDFKIEKKGVTCTYSYNPSAQKEGKMDVYLTYGPEIRYDQRVSAKRWQHGRGDLGYTSIDAGIHRAASVYQGGDAGQTVAEAYKLAVLNPDEDKVDGQVPNYTAVEKAHEFATFALKSDIAMGLNQGIINDGTENNGAGYANVLIVDTGNEIKVKDLAKIVRDRNIKLSGYKTEDIKSEANQIYNSISNIEQHRTQSYLGLITSVLNKMKVTINLSVNN